jgi:hypothetical protein
LGRTKSAKGREPSSSMARFHNKKLFFSDVKTLWPTTTRAW